MKYIIMKAQEAREWESLGSIAIEKPVKPAPPYIEGADKADHNDWDALREEDTDLDEE